MYAYKDFYGGKYLPTGGYSLISQIGMCRPKRFLRRFGLKTGIDFAILVWNWVCFSRKLQECMNVFVVSIANASERKSNKQIRKDFKTSCLSFVLNSTCSRSKNCCGFKRPGLKTGVENNIF